MWCTTANASLGAYEGAARTIFSLAFQPARLTITGFAVTAAVRGTAVAITGLHRKKARSRVTGPETRYWIRRAAPVQ